MTRDPLDDATIEELVRDAAAGWTMPPVRLDAPSWRVRVRGTRARRLAVARSRLGRLGRAATAAFTLTVIGALVAAVITRPPINPGQSPGSSGGASDPTATGVPEASPLPKLVLDGDLPDPSTLLVETESGQGTFAFVDLAKGSLDVLGTGGRFGSQVRALRSGGWLCLCLSESGYATDATRAVVTLDRYDASNRRIASQEIDSFAGEPYPREPGDDTQYPGNAFTSLGFSDDGRYGYVGWSVREAPVWHSVLLVVELGDGSIVSRLELPDATIGAGDATRIVTAPQVIAKLGEEELLVARPWYEWTRDGATIQMTDYQFDNDVFRAGFGSGDTGSGGVAPVQAAAGCGDAIVGGGALADGGSWIACASVEPTVTVVRRLGADDASLGDVRISGSGVPFGEHVIASPRGDRIFAWDPASATLTRFDLATGETTTGTGSAAGLDRGPLAALGDWLAPSAAAKSLIRGALVVSPDGRRVYAIGVLAGGDDREPSGSTGIFVFDADAMREVAHHDATADYVSLALSPDGRFIYAAGLPGVDATGRRQVLQGASITVISAEDGAVRLIAGALGFGMVSFPVQILD